MAMSLIHLRVHIVECVLRAGSVVVGEFVHQTLAWTATNALDGCRLYAVARTACDKAGIGDQHGPRTC